MRIARLYSYAVNRIARKCMAYDWGFANSFAI
jgi:hypothetical protein